MEFGKAPGRISPKERVDRAVDLHLRSQTWIIVTSDRRGLPVMQPNEEIFSKHSICPTNCIVQVEPDTPFRVLVTNFADYKQILHKEQVIGFLLPHPTAVVPSSLNLSEVFGITEEADSPHEDQESEHVENSPPVFPTGASKIAKDEIDHVSVDILELSNVPVQHQDSLRALLRKYPSIWVGSLGEISPTEHRIDLVPNGGPISQPPYSWTESTSGQVRRS